jgi:hypothetical protein
MHNNRDCRRFEKDGKEKFNFCAAKKGGKKAKTLESELCTADQEN